MRPLLRPVTPEDDLERTREHLRLALDAGCMGVWEQDLPSGKMTWSASLERIHGLPAGAFGGTLEDAQRTIHPDDRDRTLAVIEKATQKGQAYRVEYRIVLPNGTIRWVETRGRPYCGEGGRPVSVTGVSGDITQRKEWQRALQRQTALTAENDRLHQEVRTAQDALRARDRLLALVAHDLRDPLNSMALSAQLILQKRLVKESPRRHAERILEAANRASRLIQDLLLGATLEEGAFKVERRRLDPRAVVSDALAAARARASERSIRLEGELPDELPPIHGDADRLTQVFSNLLSNALKVTPDSGRITVRAEATEDRVRFSVADSGPGIQADELPHLFEPFWQGREKHRGGTGLGLWIARGIVESHGGRIQAESGPGAGTVFSFTIPLSGRPDR